MLASHIDPAVAGADGSLCASPVALLLTTDLFSLLLPRSQRSAKMSSGCASVPCSSAEALSCAGSTGPLIRGMCELKPPPWLLPSCHAWSSRLYCECAVVCNARSPCPTEDRPHHAPRPIHTVTTINLGFFCLEWLQLCLPAGSRRLQCPVATCHKRLGSFILTLTHRGAT